jgi:tRNA(Ile)-lysidine synthase
LAAKPISFEELREVMSQPPFAVVSNSNQIAVAVSGGPDSLALAHLLSLWSAQTKGPKITALIVDHALRPGSAAEAKAVKKLLSSYKNIRATILTRAAPRSRTKMLEQARFDRYALMIDYCKAAKISHLFLGHHQDDQAETFLLRLAGGSGLDGLAAMRPAQARQEGVTLLRPLLEFPKDRLQATCEAGDIAYVEDPTNQAAEFARPRLRQARDALAREGLTAKRLSMTAQRMERARLALDTVAAALYQKTLQEKKSKRIVFKLKMLYEQPGELVLRVLIKGYQQLQPDQTYAPRLERLEHIANDLQASADKAGAKGAFRKRTLGGVIFEIDQKQGLLILSLERSGFKNT